jgi:hypothetical protein
MSKKVVRSSKSERQEQLVQGFIPLFLDVIHAEQDLKRAEEALERAKAALAHFEQESSNA